MAVRTLASGLPMEDRAARDAERSRVWRKLVRNPAAIAGVLVLAAVVVIWHVVVSMRAKHSAAMEILRA